MLNIKMLIGSIIKPTSESPLQLIIRRKGRRAKYLSAFCRKLWGLLLFFRDKLSSSIQYSDGGSAIKMLR
jgi:hypothetical protein